MIAVANKAKSIFLDAVELASAEERQAYLAEQCVGDDALRRDVADLLRHHGDLDGFLDPSELIERPGTMIGPYKLLEQIGEGGMGLVFMAEQTEPIRRKVALKIIKPGMDTRQVVARFEAERQALALMDHPNIAKILDAGTTCSEPRTPVSGEALPLTAVRGSDRPYFVMELVRGVPITEFCDQHRYTPKQRLALFVTVCQAVQHAHQKGVIHRDLKPSNVLVTLHDTVAVPKIIDFGIAKALDQPLTERTMFTNFAQMIGTPQYMSPEQAQMNSLDIDTRSDVYSLGVLVYELLTGTTPFDSEKLKQVGFDEMRRLIREEDPPRPSQRISALEAQALTTLSERRGVDGRRLCKSLRGELDWVVMKALEKDRNRRYDSVSALAEDVQRYLDDEPIKAKPPTWRDKAAKWGRKHPALTTGFGLALGLLIAGSWAWHRETRNAEKSALAVAQESDQLRDADRLPEALQAARLSVALLPRWGGDAGLRREVEQRVEDLQLLTLLEEIRLQPAVGMGGVPGPGEMARVATRYRQAFQDYGVDLLAGDEGAVIEVLKQRPIGVQIAAVLSEQGENAVTNPEEKLRMSRLVDALDADARRIAFRCLEAARAKDREALKRLATEAESDPPHPAVLCRLGIALRSMSCLAEEERVLRAGQKRYPADFMINHELACALSGQRSAEAVGFFRAALALRPHYSYVWYNFGTTLNNAGNHREAAESLRRAIGLKPDFAPAYSNLGYSLRHLGKYVEAEASFRQAIALEPKDDVAHTLLGALLCDALKRPDEGAAEFRRAMALKPNDHQHHLNLGNALSAIGRYDEAAAAYRQVISLNPTLAAGQYGLGESLHLMGLIAEAEAAYREAIRLKPDYSSAYGRLGNALIDQRRPKDAESAFREMIRLEPDFPVAHCMLGFALQLQGKFEEALPPLRRGHELGSRQRDFNFPTAMRLREAERLVELDAKLSDLLSGEAQPADAADQVVLAELCYYKKYYAAAARFYSGAFASDPKLRNNWNHYSALCAAARAGAADGADAETVDESVRAQLRRQALDSLQAILSTLAHRASTPAERSNVRKNLLRFQCDPDLAGVRDPAALTKFPEVERGEWEKLWADVAALLKKTEEPNTDIRPLAP